MANNKYPNHIAGGFFMGNLIPEDVIEEIRSRLNLVDIVSEYLQLKKAGRSYMGLCPFHHEKTPSFTVSPDKQIFHCFGCGTGGNLFTFVMQMENIGFPEVAKMMAKRAGVELPEKQESATAKKKNTEKEHIRKAHLLAMEFYHYILLKSAHGKKALEYLQKRGLSKETVLTFRLGFALDSWDSLRTFLVKKGFQEKFLIRAGLLQARSSGKGSYDKFRNRIIFPIFDVRGQIIAFGGRILGQGEPKYLNSPETLLYDKSRHLYGLNLVRQEIRQRKKAIIFEGYMDVISTYQSGINYGVASLGTSMTEHQAYLLRNQTEEVYLAYDPDEAGQAATTRALEVLKEAGALVKVAELPKGLDPDDYIRKYGKETFEKNIIGKALPVIEYQLKRIKSSYNLSKREEIIQYGKKVIPFLASITSAIERDSYINKISEETNISQESLRQEIKEYPKKNKGNRKSFVSYNNGSARQNISRQVSGRQLSKEKAQEKLLAIFLSNQDFVAKAKQEISVEFFDHELLAKVFEKIFNLFESKESINAAKLVNYFQQQEIKNLLTKISTDNTIVGKEEKIYQDCLYRLKKTHIESRMEAIEKQMKNTDNQNQEGLDKLLLKWAELKKMQDSLSRSKERGGVSG